MSELSDRLSDWALLDDSRVLTQFLSENNLGYKTWLDLLENDQDLYDEWEIAKVKLDARMFALQLTDYRNKDIVERWHSVIRGELNIQPKVIEDYEIDYADDADIKEDASNDIQ